jgi:HEAT repeat protein
MDAKFTHNEIGSFVKYAVNELEHSGAAELALKAASTTPGVNLPAFLSEAIDECKLSQWAQSYALKKFARFDRLDLIIDLLQNNSSKVQVAALSCIESLGDVRTLHPLSELMRGQHPENIKQKAAVVYQKIFAKQERPTNDTYVALTTINDLDLALGDFILQREFSDKSPAVLLNVLVDPPVEEMAKLAKETLMKLGPLAGETVLHEIGENPHLMSGEVIEVLGNYPDPRASRLVIEYSKAQGSYANHQVVEALGKIGGEDAALFLAERIVKSRNNDHEVAALKKTGILPKEYLLSAYRFDWLPSGSVLDQCPVAISGFARQTCSQGRH